ncbi:MAG: hypothetical protein P8Y18_01015 [Candidatus Bathyarchaeota archaeon]
MNKKKILGLFFGFLLIFGMMIVISYTIPNSKEMEVYDDSIKVITSSYSGVSYDLFYSSNFSGNLVLFAGGILGHKQYCSGWASILAEEGYGVLTFSTPPEDLDNVPRYAENCKNNIETLLPFIFDTSVFPIPINEESISLVGMSGGGAATLSMNDTRIKTSVAICPYYIDNSSVDNVSPVLIITGSDDYIAPSDSHGLEYYEELNPNKMIIEQSDVGHDMSPIGWKHLVAWLDYYVNDDYSAFSTLTSAEDDPEISFSENDFSTLPSDIL